MLLIILNIAVIVTLQIARKRIPNNNPSLMYLQGQIKAPIRYLLLSILLFISIVILTVQAVDLIFNFGN